MPEVLAHGGRTSISPASKGPLLMISRLRVTAVLTGLTMTVAAVLVPLVSAGPGSRAAAAPAGDGCPVSVADAVAAARAAAGCRGRVEVASARSEKTQVFANANGTFTQMTAAVTQRVRTADGAWTRPDPTLRRAANGGFEPTA